MKTVVWTSRHESQPGFRTVSLRQFWLLAFLLAAHSVWANQLISVRIGPHKSFDRLVFEFESEAQSFVTVKDPHRVEILFRSVATHPSFSLPSLPAGLGTVRAVDAFRQGEHDLVFEITLVREVAASELPLAGKPWRLAIDLTPKDSRTQEDKPEYVPGDRPIQTRFAEAKVEPETELRVSLKLDPVKVRAVLAYFYVAIGDTSKAQSEADRYMALTGIPLDLSPDFNLAERSEYRQPQQVQASSTSPISYLWLFAIALASGLAGGLISSHVPRWIRYIRDGIVSRTPRQAIERLHLHVKEDLERLHKTVHHPPEKVAPPLPTESKRRQSNPSAEKVPVAELATPKENVMDRRVRKVLDLFREGRDIAAIAKELEMGQDEVKLIIDLNK